MSEQTTYRVKGMACEGCVATVSEALKAALPGAAVQVVLDGGRVTVTGSHDPAAVARAVEQADFEFEGPAQPG